MEYPAGVVRSGSWDVPVLSAGRAWSEKVCVLVEGLLERVAGEGESPVPENAAPPRGVFPSSTEPVEFGVNLAGPPAKPEYSLVTDSGRVP